MKRIVIILFLIFFTLFPSSCIASQISQDEIISSQKETLNITKFINEAKKYTSHVFEDVDYQELLNSVISGKVDNELLGKSVLNILGKETLSSIRIIASIIVIIVIHSIIKSISEGLENKSVSQNPDPFSLLLTID